MFPIKHLSLPMMNLYIALLSLCMFIIFSVAIIHAWFIILIVCRTEPCLPSHICSFSQFISHLVNQLARHRFLQIACHLERKMNGANELLRVIEAELSLFTQSILGRLVSGMLLTATFWNRWIVNKDNFFADFLAGKVLCLDPSWCRGSRARCSWWSRHTSA